MLRKNGVKTTFFFFQLTKTELFPGSSVVSYVHRLQRGRRVVFTEPAVSTGRLPGNDNVSRRLHIAPSRFFLSFIILFFFILKLVSILANG